MEGEDMAGFVVLNISQEDYDEIIRNKVIDELLEKQLETLEDFKYWENSSGYPIHSLSETQRISKCKELIKRIAEQMKAGGRDKRLSERKC